MPLALHFDASDGTLLSTSGVQRPLAQKGPPQMPQAPSFVDPRLPSPTFSPPAKNPQGHKAACRVLVRASISAKGAVVNAVVEESSGLPQVDAAALDAVRQWAYIPAWVNGANATRDVLVPMQFEATE